MNKKLLQSIDYLITKSESKAGLVALEKIFAIGIPFNKPHGIKFISLTPFESEMKMRKKRLNLNHLGGIHACAIATLGEFSAGLLLCKNFQMSSYRVIMKKIEVEYFSQGRVDIKASAHIDAVMIESLKKEIQQSSKADIELKTYIFDIKDKKIALVKTLWQLKDWSQVGISST